MRAYQIPANVVTRFEFSPGFGWGELAITMMGIVFGGVLFLLFGLFHVNVGARLIIVIVCASGAFLSQRKVDGVFSLMTYLRMWRAWGRRPKEYWLW